MNENCIMKNFTILIEFHGFVIQRNILPQIDSLVVQFLSDV